ncbi:MAG: pitrilysin family protein [Candidatus Aureabacteria bacterium]|nr:pitrilysin family protein [Candidatus Auribacterota bacterium]
MKGELRSPSYESSVLPSGMRVVTCEMPSMESVALGLWVGIGGRYEERKKNGISHFLEHILFKGTRKRSALEISQAIESVGGSLNGFTGEEYTCYMAKVIHRHLKRAADVLTDMFLHPVVRSEDVEKERIVIREEINMYRDTPQHHVMDLLNEVLWTDHPLGRPLVGTPETILTITQNDLRMYQRRSYTPANTVCAVAGGVRHSEVMKIMDTLIPKRPRGRVPTYMAARDRQRKPKLLVQKKNTEQTHLCVAVRGYSRNHPSRYALQLLSIVAGENMSSRLFQRIREKRGLAYAIHSSIIRYRDTGAFTVYAGVENKKALAVIALIMRELGKMARGEGVTQSELARAKLYWEGQLAMELEKTTSNMLSVGESMLCSGHILTKQEILSKINKVKLQDVHRVAADIFADEKLSLAAVGPLPEKEDVISDSLHF